MSKKMSCAYSALKVKDWSEAVQGWFIGPALAFAVMSMVSMTFAIIAIALLAVVFVSRVISVACNVRMRGLGFSEYELERQGLA